MKLAWRVGAALAATIVVAGCATPPPSTASAEWIAGRLALKVAAHAPQPARSVSGAFELRSGDGAGELHLLAPLGARIAQARWSADAAVLATGDGERRYADLAELSRDVFGESLPLDALPDWIAGRPWPRAPHEATAEGFAQLGFGVDTSRVAAGAIVARRSVAPAIELRIQLDDR